MLFEAVLKHELGANKTKIKKIKILHGVLGRQGREPTNLKCFSVESESERRLHLSVEGECSQHSSHRSQMQRKQIIKRA